MEFADKLREVNQRIAEQVKLRKEALDKIRDLTCEYQSDAVQQAILDAAQEASMAYARVLSLNADRKELKAQKASGVVEDILAKYE